MSVKLGEAEASETAKRAGSNKDRNAGRLSDQLKLRLPRPDPRVGLPLNIDPDLRGVLITAVDPNGDAFRESNPRRGMVITGVNGTKVTSIEELERIYEKLDAGENLLLQVVQADGSGTMVTALTKPE